MQVVPIGIPTLCLYYLEPNLIKYCPASQMSDMTTIYIIIGFQK